MKLSFLTFALTLLVLPLCYSMTPNLQLLEAVKKCNLQQVQEALNNGANVNAQDEYGKISLQWATDQGDIIIVKLLLKHGADINVPDKYGRTSLHGAAINGYAEITKLLLDSGANVTLKDKHKKRTALDWAREGNDLDTLQALEEYSLLHQESQVRPTKKTLHKAIQSNYPSMVKLLLQKGIIAGKEDLKLAKELDHKEIGRILIKYLGATTGQSGISTTGITNIENISITPEIARYIMGQVI